MGGVQFKSDEALDCYHICLQTVLKIEHTWTHIGRVKVMVPFRHLELENLYCKSMVGILYDLRYKSIRHDSLLRNIFLQFDTNTISREKGPGIH
jgi:hypothetical protein